MDNRIYNLKKRKCLEQVISAAIMLCIHDNDGDAGGVLGALKTTTTKLN